MKQVFLFCFAISVLIGCTSSFQKIEGVYVNESTSDNNLALFFLFQDDSLIIRSHELFSKQLKLKYNKNDIVVSGYNDSIKFNLTQNKHFYKINYKGENFLSLVGSDNSKVSTADISPISINYKNVKPISGYWKSTNAGNFDKSWLYINDNQETISVSYLNDELVNFGTNKGSISFPIGKILNINNIYLFEFLSDSYNQETYLIDYLSDDRIQLFSIFDSKKVYYHFKRTNFEYLPKDLKELIIKKEDNPTRFDFEGGKMKPLKVVTSDFEVEIEEIVPVKIE